MFFLRKIIALSLLLLWLAACSDDGSSGKVVLRVDEDGESFSPTELQGSVEYLPSMKPEAVRIVRLDDKLNALDSLELPLDSTYMDRYAFRVESRDYEYPYIKVVTVFPSEDSIEKMEFAQYMRLTGDNTQLKQNLFAGLAVQRIENLVRNKKYSFVEAERSAMAALGVVFDMELKDVNKRKYSGFGTNGYYGDRLDDMQPYIYCRHEISDSVFYSNFKKFRKAFGEKGTIDSSWIIKAADTWLATFEVLADSADYLFKSVSRDSVNDLGWLDKKFFGRAYGIDFSLTAGAQNIVSITEKRSAFYGRNFIVESHRKNGLITNRWRLRSVLEDSLGSCIYDSYDVIYGGSRFIQRNDTLYACRGDSHIWEIITERDSLFNHQFGECSKYSNIGQPVYVHDSLFVCECESSGECSWSDKYVEKVFQESDTMYAKLIDARATARFGKCTYENSSVMQKLDSVYIECVNEMWNPIDSLLYHLGRCTSDNYRGEYHGVYYSCQGKWPNIDETTWHEIYPPEYYNDECDLNRIVKYDSSYYTCEQDECEGDGCFAFMRWRKLEDTELIPPVLNMDTCESPQQNLKIVYDDVFYQCKDGKWITVPEDSLLPLEKDGLICMDSLFGEVKRYGGDYYRCGTNRVWKTLNGAEATAFRFRDSLGLCDTISEKILHWDEPSLSFVGCTTMDSVYKWDRINVDVLPENFDRKKFAGNRIDGTTYDVTVDGVDYHFDIHKISYAQQKYNFVLTQVDFDGESYGAYLYMGHLFLHSARGTDSLLLMSIESPSATFNDFYTSWKKRIGETWRCGGQNIEVLDSNVFVILYGNRTFMDYEKAKAFCPEGFHIPSEVEMTNGFRYFTTTLGYRNDSPVSWTFVADRVGCSLTNEIYADVFWTSTEKDSETQYCYETSMRTVTMDSKEMGIIECPKDLFPMVQTLCVQDE